MIITKRRIRAIFGAVSDARLRKHLRLPASDSPVNIRDVLESPVWPQLRDIIVNSIVVDEM